MTNLQVAMKRRNQVRITGGYCRSRMIHFLAHEQLRPTNDFVRERIFNWLGQNLTGKSVLDVFSGSGILAFESASRGAKKVIAVEKNYRTYQAIIQNQQKLQLPQIESVHSDALNYLSCHTQVFDIIFLDPPYIWDHWQKLWELLTPCMHSDTLVYLERDQPINPIKGLDIYRSGRSGISHFALLQITQ